MKRFDIVLYLGSTFSETIFLDTNEDLSSGYTAELKIKAHPLSEEVLMTLSTADGDLELTEFGELKIRIDHDDEDIPERGGVYNVLMTKTSDDTKTFILWGYFIRQVSNF